MILGRIHLIILFHAELQRFSKQIWTELIGTEYPSFRTFFNFVFKRLKRLSTTFWFWWYVIQQPFTKIFNLLFMFIFCLSFVVTFDGLQSVGCKTGVGSFGIGS